MHFKMAQDVRSYFGNIINIGGSHATEDRNKFLIFDPYYCCALIGMAACMIDEDESGMVDIIQGYPGAYRDSKAYIAGLLVASEVKRRFQGANIRNIESATLENVMLDYLTCEDDTLLTDSGVKRLNEYSRRGAQLYRELFPDPPTTREEFLTGFNRVMQIYSET